MRLQEADHRAREAEERQRQAAESLNAQKQKMADNMARMRRQKEAAKPKAKAPQLQKPIAQVAHALTAAAIVTASLN